MDAKSKKLAVITIATILLSLSLLNMKIVSSATGGKIDLFTQKEPYSGKGSNMPSDAFSPGEEVQVYALVTYNEEPMQNILVAFGVMGPVNSIENITFFRSAITDETGIATISFRIPYLNETVFGEWTVIGNAQIGNMLVQDKVSFKVDWIISITSLKTVNYMHVEQETFSRESHVGVEFTLRNIAFTEKRVTLEITLYDALDIPINATQHIFDFPPNTTQPLTFFVYIPKTACAGKATVYVCAYTSPVELGGVPYCPEASKTFVISKSCYFLAVKTEPENVTAISGEGWYDENTSVNLTAPNIVSVSAGIRYKFSYWDVDGTPQNMGATSINVLMDANHTATAHYILQHYLTVRTDPPGIAAILGEGWHDNSTNVTLNAPEVYGYTFKYWDIDGVPQGENVNPITVHMNAPHSATAHYVRITYTLTILVTKGGTTEPAPGNYTYPANMTVQVKAISDANYIFDHWELDNVNVGSVNPYQLTMDKDHVLKAVFSPVTAGWFVPAWFYWLLILILVLIVLLLALLFYRRKKRKEAEATFRSGWTAWYYCRNLRCKIAKIKEAFCKGSLLLLPCSAKIYKKGFL